MTRWIFLRGWMREARHWGGFVDDFRAFNPEAEVLAVDLPGAGLRSAEMSPATVFGIMAACRGSVAERRDLHLLGLSLGGMVAAEWARRHPEEVARVVTLNTSAAGACKPWQRLRLGSWGAVAAALATSDVARREARVLALTSREPAQHPEAVGEWSRYAREHPMRRAAAFAQLLAAARFQARPQPVPTLVLTSRCDRLVDPACSKALARLWNAELAMHPSAGHDLALDDGAWVAAQVRRWMAR